MAKPIVRDWKMTLWQSIKNNFKQWLWDAADTILRAPARIAWAMWLKQSQGNKSPNNKGEQAFKNLKKRAGSAITAFRKTPKK
jgi:hypothetical protein